MKRIVFLSLLTVFLSSFAFAQESPDYLTMWVETPEYRYRTATDDQNVLIVQTVQDLTLEKDSIIKNKRDLKLATEPAETLYGRLLKISDVSGVTLTHRALYISKFPFRTEWPSSIDEILAALDQTLGKAD